MKENQNHNCYGSGPPTETSPNAAAWPLVLGPSRPDVERAFAAGRLAGIREAAEVIVAQIQAPYTGARSDDFMNGWAQGANATAERSRSAILALAERGEG